MSVKTRVVLLALAAASVGVAVLLDRWNRQLEAAVALPNYEARRRHPSSGRPVRVRFVPGMPGEVARILDGRRSS